MPNCSFNLPTLGDAYYVEVFRAAYNLARYESEARNHVWEAFYPLAVKRRQIRDVNPVKLRLFTPVHLYFKHRHGGLPTHGADEFLSMANHQPVAHPEISNISKLRISKFWSPQ